MVQISQRNSLLPGILETEGYHQDSPHLLDHLYRLGIFMKLNYKDYKIFDMLNFREEMWLPAPKMISKGLTSIQSSNQLDDTVYLSQPKVALAAVNMTLRNSDGLHYKIFVSLIPPNVDVWGWVKYYHHQAVENPKPLKEGQQEDVASKVIQVTFNESVTIFIVFLNNIVKERLNTLGLLWPNS